MDTEELIGPRQNYILDRSLEAGSNYTGHLYSPSYHSGREYF
jgi:hypothetical protein